MKAIFEMNSKLILIILSVIGLIYFSVGLRDSFYYFKNEPSYNSTVIFIKKIGGIILSIIFIFLYLFGVI